MRRILPVVLLVFIGVFVYVVNFSGVFAIRSIRFNEGWVPAEEVLAKIGVEKGDNLLLLSPRVIRNHIAEDPRFEAVSMRKKYPDELVLQISYRTPVARLVYGNASVYVDASALILLISEEVYDMVVIEGMALSNAKMGRRIDAGEGSRFRLALDLADLVEQAGMEVESISFDGENQLILRMAEDFVAIFGEPKDLEQSFTIFIPVYQDVIKDGPVKGRIDMRSLERPMFSPFAEEVPENMDEEEP